MLLDIDSSEPQFMRTSTTIQTVVVIDVPDASSLHQLGISRWRMFLPVRLTIEAVARGVGESHGVIKFFAGPKSCVGWWYPPSPRLLGLPFLVVVSGSGSTAQGVARKTPRFGLNQRLATQYGRNIHRRMQRWFLPRAAAKRLDARQT